MGPLFEATKAPLRLQVSLRRGANEGVDRRCCCGAPSLCRKDGLLGACDTDGLRECAVEPLGQVRNIGRPGEHELVARQGGCDFVAGQSRHMAIETNQIEMADARGGERISAALGRCDDTSEVLKDVLEQTPVQRLVVNHQNTQITGHLFLPRGCVSPWSKNRLLRARVAIWGDSLRVFTAPVMQARHAARALGPFPLKAQCGSARTCASTVATLTDNQSQLALCHGK